MWWSVREFSELVCMILGDYGSTLATTLSFPNVNYLYEHYSFGSLYCLLFCVARNERSKLPGLQIEIGESAFCSRYRELLDLDVTWLQIYWFKKSNSQLVITALIPRTAKNTKCLPRLSSCLRGRAQQQRPCSLSFPALARLYVTYIVYNG